MKNVLLESNELLKDLFPWDDINYGVDEQWVRVYPYGQKASPGQTVEYTVKIFNHSDVPKTFIIEPVALKGFTIDPHLATLVIQPRTEGERTFKIKVSEQVPPGVSVLTASIKFDQWDLQEWSEALIEIVR